MPSSLSIRRALAVLAVCLVELAAAARATAAPLTIRFVNVGQGDATVFQGPCGEIGILDVAEGGDRAVLRTLGELGSRRVRWVAVTHFDDDHSGGVRALATAPGVEIGTVFDRGVPDEPTKTYEGYDAWLKASGRKPRHVRTGHSFMLCHGKERVDFEVVSVASGRRKAAGGLRVSDENDRGICLKVTYVRFKMAACGDASKTLEHAVAETMGKVALAKIDHHGSRGSSDPVYVDTLAPSVAVVSAGKNSYGHPSPEVLRRWEEHADVYQTAAADGVVADGDVTATTDGTSSVVVRTATSTAQHTYALPQQRKAFSMPVAADNTTLSSTEGTVLLALVLVGSLLAGLVVILGRKLLEQDGGSPQSLVRSWLAVSLVFGLLAFCAAAFWIDDPQLRNTLIGGLVASAGAATAFYFSSKGADQARTDILKTATALAQGGAPPTTFSAAAPPAATTGKDYTYTFVSDGTPPLSYAVGSGTLPAGLKLEPDGTLHGTPTAPGASHFTVIARNAVGSHATQPIDLAVADAVPSS